MVATLYGGDELKPDISEGGLAHIDPHDRDAWKASFQHSLVQLITLNGEWEADSILIDKANLRDFMAAAGLVILPK